MRIQITSDQIQSRQLTVEHLAQAVGAARQSRFAIPLVQVISTQSLASLFFEPMFTDLDSLFKASDPIHAPAISLISFVNILHLPCIQENEFTILALSSQRYADTVLTTGVYSYSHTLLTIDKNFHHTLINIHS